MSRSKAVKEAQLLIERFNLSPPIDVQLLAEKLGIEVHFRAFDEPLSGVLVSSSDSSTIGVNAGHAVARQRFTIAHEIGHYVLHRDQKSVFVDEAVFFRKAPSPETQKQETEANLFAASLLMPAETVLKRVGHYVDVYDEATIRKVAREFGVSSHALTIRLQDLGVA